MAKTRRYLKDLGSEEVELLRLQVNRLTAAVEALVAASQLADFPAFKGAAEHAAADLEELSPKIQPPAMPRFPLAGE